MGDLHFLKEKDEKPVEITMADVHDGLRKCKTHMDFLIAVRDTPGLNLIVDEDTGFSELQFKGVHVPGSLKERFKTASDINDLLILAEL